MSANRSYHPPHDYRLFPDKNMHGPPGYANENGSAYVSNNQRLNHEFMENEGRYTYVPPQSEDRNYSQQHKQAFSNQSSFPRIQDDKTFIDRGRAILASLDSISRSFSYTSAKEVSIAKVLELHKMMATQELIEFNNALKDRLRVDKSQ